MHTCWHPANGEPQIARVILDTVETFGGQGRESQGGKTKKDILKMEKEDKF